MHALHRWNGGTAVHDVSSAQISCANPKHTALVSIACQHADHVRDLKNLLGIRQHSACMQRHAAGNKKNAVRYYEVSLQERPYLR